MWRTNHLARPIGPSSLSPTKSSQVKSSQNQFKSSQVKSNPTHPTPLAAPAWPPQHGHLNNTLAARPSIPEGRGGNGGSGDHRRVLSPMLLPPARANTCVHLRDIRTPSERQPPCQPPPASTPSPRHLCLMPRLSAGRLTPFGELTIESTPHTTSLSTSQHATMRPSEPPPTRRARVWVVLAPSQRGASALSDPKLQGVGVRGRSHGAAVRQRWRLD